MRTPIRAIPPILGVVAMIVAGIGCSRESSDRTERSSASEVSAELEDRLLRPGDLPGEWEPVAKENSASDSGVDLDAIRPSSCAQAIDQLRGARAGLTTRNVSDASASFATDEGELRQAIAAVPAAESTTFLMDVEAMVDACEDFAVVNAGGARIAAHTATAELGQGAGGYALIQSLTDGAGFGVQQAYVYLVHGDKLAVLVLTTSETSIEELDLQEIVAAARWRFAS